MLKFQMWLGFPFLIGTTLATTHEVVLYADTAPEICVEIHFAVSNHPEEQMHKGQLYLEAGAAKSFGSATNVVPCAFSTPLDRWNTPSFA